MGEAAVRLSVPADPRDKLRYRFSFFFLSIFSSVCFVMAATIILFFLFLLTLPYVADDEVFLLCFLLRNFLDKDFRKVIIKNYMEHCALKVV